MKLPSILKTPLLQNQQQMPYLSSKLYECKNRFGLIGPVGSGKSTIAAMLGLVTQTLSCARPDDFYCRILERNSNIYGDISNIRAGYFPEKTVAFDSYATEAGFLFAKKSNIPFGGYKKLQMPVADVAGETLQMNIRQYAQTREPLTSTQMGAARAVTQYVKQSEGIIVAADASRVVLGRGFKNAQVKTEDDKFLHRDPDVNLVRMLNDIFDYREQLKKPLKAIAIIITKWDELKFHVEHHGINIMNPDQADLTLFMDTWFPSVSQCVKAYVLDHPSTQVRFFPTFIEIERDEKSQPKFWNDDGLHQIIKAKQSEEIADWRKPACSEEVYVEFIDWLLGYAV